MRRLYDHHSSSQILSSSTKRINSYKKYIYDSMFRFFCANWLDFIFVFSFACALPLNSNFFVVPLSALWKEQRLRKRSKNQFDRKWWKFNKFFGLLRKINPWANFHIAWPHFSVGRRSERNYVRKMIWICSRSRVVSGWCRANRRLMANVYFLWIYVS